MRRFPVRILVAATAFAALAGLAACAPAPTPRPVALTATAPIPTVVVLDGQAPDGELADARQVLNALPDSPRAGGRPDLLAVARSGFACWEAAAEAAPRLSEEGAACRTDFWGAAHALSPPRTMATR